MSRRSLPPRRGRLGRATVGLAVALAVPLTMGVSCDPGRSEEDQQEQQDQEQEDDDGGEQDGDDDQ